MTCHDDSHTAVQCEHTHLFHPQDGVELHRPHDIGCTDGAMMGHSRLKNAAIERRYSWGKLRHRGQNPFQVARVVQKVLPSWRSRQWDEVDLGWAERTQKYCAACMVGVRPSGRLGPRHGARDTPSKYFTKSGKPWAW